jgi:D-aminoacyl-tRNA deacylase
MVPNYALRGLDDDGILERVQMAADATGTRSVYMHRKSMKRSEASRMQALLESAGMEIVSSRDLVPL